MMELYQDNKRLNEQLLQACTQREFRPPNDIHRFRSISLSPSDSISQPGVASTTKIHQPANRPSRYPRQILWNIEDCRDDPDINLTRGNKSRPSMERAIRHADGSLINKGVWRSIRSTASHIVNERLLTLKRPSAAPSSAKQNSRKYLKKYFPSKWDDAISSLEEQEPLVALCASHWKAEHVLGTVLRDKGLNVQDANSDAESDTVEVTATTDLTVSSKRPRSPTIEDSPQKKRKGKEKATVDPDLSDVSVNPPPPASTASGPHITALSDALNLNQLGSNEKSRPDINIKFINVNPSIDNLKVAITQDLKISCGVQLLDAMLAKSDLMPSLPPSAQLQDLLTQIETADPANPLFSEDNIDAQWGHYQFRHGLDNFTYSDVTWNNVGSIDIACRLLAACIKTCKVARFLCFEKNITASGYVADHYLQTIVENLWKDWKPTEQSEPAPGPANSTTTQAEPSTSDQHVQQLDPATANTSSENASALLSIATNSDTVIRDRLKANDLKTWVVEHGITMTSKKTAPTKEELIIAILNASPSLTPSEDDISTIIENRKNKAKLVASKTTKKP
ncbi:hypothetical protein H0H81_002497 [Sphagnurus paluster]|uniref:Uncharacterized protein n=1 Tax=Sphagnurus paluster TaxID=117069 RepID=A0A9P7K1H7_9AGAR|nr:hypothetical protein H0H81_002497 [Sphagnurus paluster]